MTKRFPLKLDFGGPSLDGVVVVIKHILPHKSFSGPLSPTSPHPFSNGEFAATLKRPGLDDWRLLLPGRTLPDDRRHADVDA
ncbi:hypothetical protein CSA56_15300 [candidate division KSB3 bacterium]|uniref:Uncharacterized protein n=1 Tax=candidate division KSB3 bacterium TaxID=2044937 RepID=A0A2G6KCC6_9BACT|nr:MAG: hypothetical protein CSA56_15300 [candidate division KSB3 bacterium]